MIIQLYKPKRACTTSKSCILKIRRLIRNFLWFGKTEGNARSKMKWDVITLPCSTRRLGIIDPVAQSITLLCRLLVRGYTSGQEIWKVLLLDRYSNCSPRLGAPLIEGCKLDI